VVTILILVAPLGVAGQNIGLCLSLIIFGILMARSSGRELLNALNSSTFKQYAILWSLILIPILAGTFIRGDLKEASRFFWGHFLVLQLMVMSLALRSRKFNNKLILNVVCSVMALLGIVALTQFLFGWKLQGVHLLPQIKRAQGFYSHPLTFAYAALVIMPWCTARLMAKPKDPRSWIIALSLAVIVLTSQSVTVIVLCFIFATILGFKLLSRKQLATAFLLGLATSILVLSVPNPISEKFRTVLSGQRSDHETNYPDDRMAFWHANWEMFKDDPIFGHGAGLGRSDRQPYYEKIGLGHLQRMYEAHNMFLQYAVEGGCIPPMALLAFFVWWHLHARRHGSNQNWERPAFMLTPLMFALGGLTQNAVQDSEVRFMLLFVCALSFWAAKSSEQIQ
jgi:O-antigen ligase